MIFLKVKNEIQNTKRGFTPTPIHIGVSSQGERGFTPTPILRTNASVVKTDGVHTILEQHSTFFGGIGVSSQGERGFIPYERTQFNAQPVRKNFMRKRADSRTGFTLVETLVAISILLVAVVAPLTLITSNISSAFGVKDKITALYLAEDAIDFVKYRIATNFNPPPQYWLFGLDNCDGGSLCQIDSYNGTIDPYTGAVLKFDSATGIYGYVSGQDSKFTRTITVTGLTPVANDPYPAQAPQEVIITTTVEWQDHGVPKQTTISEHAFAWGT